MEVRMHPRTEGRAALPVVPAFVDPRTRIHTYRDYLGNSIHHFDASSQNAPGL